MWAWILCLCLSLALTVYSCITPVDATPPVLAESVVDDSKGELKRTTTTTRTRMRKPTSTYEIGGDDEGSSNTISPASST